MAAKKGKSKRRQGAVVKPSVKKRTLNDAGQQPTKGDPFQQQDVKRRLGDFTTAGEHARVGRRKTGIVGQTKKQWGTNKKLPKKGKKRS